MIGNFAENSNMIKKLAKSSLQLINAQAYFPIFHCIRGSRKNLSPPTRKHVLAMNKKLKANVGDGGGGNDN